MTKPSLTKIITASFILLLCIIWGLYAKSSGLAGIPVLNYHKVEDNFSNSLAINVSEFEEQMAYLKQNGYTSITPDQLINHLQKGAALPEKPILITLDDGYRDNYTTAYPIMRKYGFTATIFLITDEIGNNERYLTWEQIIEMRRNGFVFGTHTLSHFNLTEGNDEYVLFQLVKSREGAEWKLDAPVKYLAYPGGAYNARVEQLAQIAGYNAAFSTKFGKVTTSSDIYALERLPLFRSSFTFLDFYLRLNFTDFVETLKKLKSSISPATNY